MSRRVYVRNFFDINRDYKLIESEKNLTEIEWQVKENQHNIDMLNERHYDRLKPLMRDPIKKR